VDFVLVDWSNDAPYEPACDPPQGMDRWDLATLEAATVPLFEVFAELGPDAAPRVAFLAGSPGNRTDYDALPGGRLACKADQIFERFVANETLGAQYFRMDGKPLLVDCACVRARCSLLSSSSAGYLPGCMLCMLRVAAAVVWWC
jgi:hypothetical protein